MAGPWEKYQQAPAAGPWQKYAPPAPAQQPATPAVNQGVDAPTYVIQRGARGIADAVGAPVDFAAMAVNLGLMGVDKVAELFGGNVDSRVTKPFMGSDWIAERTADVGEAIGTPVIPPEAVSPGIRTAGAAARGAAGALVPAMPLASGPVQSAGLLKTLSAPYAVNPGATIMRDAVAGAGAGLGSGVYDQLTPDAVKDSVAGPFLQAAASLLGGLGGATLTSVAEGAGGAAVNAGRNMIKGRYDPDAPINPATGNPFTRAEMDSAARVVQQMPTNRAQAVANIEQNANDFAQFARPSEIPTTGMLADDVGMAMQENILRSKDAKRFAERDAARRSAASARVDQSAPAGANPRAFTDTAEAQYDDILRGAKEAVDNATQDQSAAQRDLQRQTVDLETYRANQPRASAALDSEFRAARSAGRSAKNAAYDAVDSATPAPGGKLAAAVDAIDSQMANAERMAPGAYSEIAGRVRRLVEDIDPETGAVTYKDVTYGDLKALRAQISEARKNAIAASGQSVAGSGADVQRLDQLGRIVNSLTDEINPEAARYYAQEYAPRFKEGRAGEYGAAVDRAERTGGESSATRPSEFGDKFLRRPEDAASLKRALTPEQQAQAQLPGEGGRRTSSLFPETEQNVRDWMMGDLAKAGVLTENAEIRYDKFKQWADRNRQTIDQFPEVARTVDAELSRVQRGGALSKQLAEEVAAAKDRLKITERDLRRSALQSAIGNSPENAVDSIMRSGDPEKQLTEMVGRLKGNREATDGLKGAVRDWIKSEAGVTSAIVGDAGATRLSRAKLENLFRKHEATLAKVYSPDEMNALRQAHAFMDFEGKLDVRTTAGSNTVDKAFAAQNQQMAQRQRLLEAALKAKFGVLKGGGVFRTITLFLQSLPNGRQAIDDIMFELHFNPDLAVHLMTRPVSEVDTKPWNARLNALLAAASGAREANDGGEKRRPLELTITPKDKKTAVPNQ